MTLTPTESSSEYLIDEQQLELEANDFSDPYVIAELVEMQNETFEDIGFQDYLGLLPE